MAFFLLFFVPVAITLVFYCFQRHNITLTEFAIQVVVCAAVAGISVSIIYHQNVDDLEVFNGIVTAKAMETINCQHTFDCDCHTVRSCSTDSKGNETCTDREECDTCYEHHSTWSHKSPGNDYNWVLSTSINTNIYISRIDRQGKNEPPRYTLARISDPVAERRTFENYIKAAPNTLFQRQGLVEKYKSKLISYPASIYNYHYLDRVVSNYKVPNISEWNSKLSLMNSRLQRAQGNVILVLLNNVPQDYVYALEQHWMGGKKNDAVVIIETSLDKEIEWVYVMSWTKNELFKVNMRDNLLDMGKLDIDKIIPIIESNMNSSFHHRSMHDFEYLKASIVPTASQMTWAVIIEIIIAIVLCCVFAHPDVHVDISSQNTQTRRRKYPYNR